MAKRTNKSSKKTSGPDKNWVAAMVGRQIRLAMGYMGGDLSSERANATNYYLGSTFGDEISNASQTYGITPDGRSKVNSLDVSDTIEWAMPSMMRIFLGNEKAVSFDPVNADDVDNSKQATDYVRYVVFKKNPGYQILYTMFKDAFLHKTGVVKYYWKEDISWKQESYDNLTDEEYLALANDPDLELVRHEEIEITYDGVEIDIDKSDSMHSTLPTSYVHNAVFKKKHNNSGIVIENIAPEYFGISRNQRRPDFKDCEFCYQRIDVPRYKLIEMGFDKDLVMTLNYTDFIENPEQIARYELIDERRLGLYESPDPATQVVPTFFCYVLYDQDDDGLAELHRVTWAANQVLEDIIVDEIPFAVITPTIVPYKFFGQSLADATMDIQRIKSLLMRQIIDNLALQNDRTTIIDQNMVNFEDFLISRPGKIVRANGAPANAVMYAPQSGLDQTPFLFLDYMDRVREGRTGIGQTTQGLNMDLLNNNKGDLAVTQMLSAAEQRLECVARTFAETGVKDLFLGVYKLLLKHQDKSTCVELSGKWTDVDPRSWQERAHVTINVGMGNGEKVKQIMALTQLTQMQQAIIQGGGMGTLVTPKNIYNTIVKLMNESGLKEMDQYITDPDSPEAQKVAQAQAQSAQSNPEDKFIQVEAAKVQATSQNKMMDTQLKAAELQQKKENDDRNFALKVAETVNKMHDTMQQHKTDIGSWVDRFTNAGNTAGGI